MKKLAFVFLIAGMFIGSVPEASARIIYMLNWTTCSGVSGWAPRWYLSLPGSDTDLARAACRNTGGTPWTTGYGPVNYSAPGTVDYRSLGKLPLNLNNVTMVPNR